MKYFGKKSLSSLMSVVLHVAWYVVLIGSIVAILAGGLIITSKTLREPIVSEIAKEAVKMAPKDRQDWEEFTRLPMPVKALVIPWFAAVAVMLLFIIKRSQEVFTNFKKDIVFNQANVVIIKKISKLLIVFAILTFDVGLLFTSVFLLMICELIKKGSQLQEEHDLTV